MCNENESRLFKKYMHSFVPIPLTRVRYRCKLIVNPWVNEWQWLHFTYTYIHICTSIKRDMFSYRKDENPASYSKDIIWKCAIWTVKQLKSNLKLKKTLYFSQIKSKKNQNSKNRIKCLLPRTIS